MDRSRIQIYLLRNIFPFFFFFTAGFIFHSRNFIRKVCTSFARLSLEERQRTVRNYEAKLNPRSLFSWIYITTLIHLFCKSSRDLLKISCFVEFHSPESVEVQYTSCRVSSAYSFRVLIYRSEYFSR